jgi:hypothetical protein
VIAVLGEKIVRSPLEYIGNFFDNGFYFVKRSDSETVEDFTFECPSWWNSLWRCIINSSHPSLVMSSICILSIVYNDSGMKKGCPNGPQD